MAPDESIEAMVIRHDEQIKNLVQWQASQNGTLGRLEAKLDGINKWLVGVMGSVIIALLLLVLNIAMAH